MLWFLGRSTNKKQAKRKKRLTRAQKIRKQQKKCLDDYKNHHINEIVAQINSEKEDVKNKPVKIELITLLKQFLDRKNIAQNINSTITDLRNGDFVKYPKESLILSALSVFLFRLGSGNSYEDQARDPKELYSEANIAKFVNAPESCLPAIKTIETFLSSIQENETNQLMINFFKDLQKSKFFRDHPEIMFGDFFLLAVDCVHTHTYSHPHHIDDKGNNNCPCCLKRVYNKETEKEKTRWIHTALVFSFVFQGSLKIPVYHYPIHSKQVIDKETVSENEHKQECELVGLKNTLPILRGHFPRMNIKLLLDGLYTNRPVIRLAEENKCGYIITKQEDSLTRLGKECDERAVTSNHKKNCVKSVSHEHQGWIITQEYQWFNSMYLGEDVTTNVLRLKEIREKKGGDTQCYNCEWLFSSKLSSKTCEEAARQARSRWEIEDLFNTMKNRGFKLKHDYSRNPSSCFHWQRLGLFAFGIFELFRFSEAVTQRYEGSQKSLAQKLFSQLSQRSTEEIFSDKALSIRVQFRYYFVIERIQSIKKPPIPEEKDLKAG
jgi:hypothetical protein